MLKQARRVTRTDVAARAGVSTATVSYVVNDGPRSVAAGTRVRVLQAIEELGYYPNELARSLRLNQTSTIGLVIPDLANPFYAELVRALEHLTFDKGYATIVCNSNRELLKEQQFAELLRAKQVDGVVFLPDSESIDAIFTLIGANIPVVVLERQDIPGLQCVAIDDFLGGRMATEHLLQLGHRRIAFLRQATSHTTSQRRVEGYAAALQAAGLQPDPRLIADCASSPGAGAAAASRLLGACADVTAIIAHNDVIALGAMHALHEAGLSIPADISLVGYDNTAASAFYHPPLTTIQYPIEAVAAAAARKLFAMLEAGAEDQVPLAANVELVPVSIVVRQSTGPARATR